MKILKLLFRINTKKLILFSILNIITGLFNVVFLMLITESITDFMTSNMVTTEKMLLAAGALLSYLILYRISTSVSLKYTFNLINKIRMELMNSVLEMTYYNMTDKKELISSAITKDSVVITSTANSVTQILSSVVIVIGSLIYICFLSFNIFFFILVISLISFILFFYKSKNNDSYLEKARISEDSLFFNTNQILDGFREIKINRKKGEEILYGPLKESSDNCEKLSYKGMLGYYDNSIIIQFIFYFSLILLLFMGNTVFNIQTAAIINCIIIFMYLMGPLAEIASSIPDIMEGNVAAKRLQDIQNSIIKEEQKSETTTSFENINIKSAYYKYNNDSLSNNFVLGPINIEFKKNTITFIKGGNGAGKTTLIYSIIGLLNFNEGEYFVNGKKADKDIRNFFAPVFYNYFLFDHLYGLKEASKSKASYYLKLFELDGKVLIQDNKFSTLDLSAGQRKRLALISILLENRPIIILDEWAADQDSFFRDKFYNQILPILKDSGFTIIAVTHDDKYFHVADSLYQMDLGKIEKKW